MKVLCVIPSLPKDLHQNAIQSILNQTYPIEMLVILPKKSKKKTLPSKVSDVLNEGLSHLKLEDFDYILRIDGDTVIPPNFLEENLKGNPDYRGKAGYAMVIKVSTFLRLMNGKFHPDCDDSYLGLKFMKEGASVESWTVKPTYVRESGAPHGVDYFVYRGELMYKLGYEPIHVFASLMWTIRNIFTIFGYFGAVARRREKYDVADFVRYKQVRRLFERLKLL